MSEGTKLGNQEDLEFDKNISKEKEDLISKDAGATKLGEVSDFEKSLYENQAVSEEEKPKNDAPIDEAPKEESVKDSKEVAEEPVAEEPATESSEKSEEAVVEEPVAEATQEPVVEKDQSATQSDDTLSEFERALEDSILDYGEGDLIKGTVRGIEKSGVLVDIGYKSDGYIPNNEFGGPHTETPSNTLEVGDDINVVIDKLETKEGYTLLSRKKALYELSWDTLHESMKEKNLLDVFVMSKVDGGLIVSYNGIRGFIPLSQLSIDSKDEVDGLLKTTLKAMVINVDRRRRKVIFSCRASQSKELSESVEKLLETMEVGKVIKGRVSSIKDFGVFVDLGGIEGLVHISELSWARVSHPSEVVKENEEYDVVVLGIDQSSKKISLGMKQLQDDPWKNLQERYTVGQIVTGKVSRIVPFGAFVQLEKDLEGLIHISELSNDHVSDISEIVSVGQEVSVSIIKLQADDQKIGLSMKAAQAQAE